MAEILRRQTKAQVDASDAQIVAANAETKAAEAAMTSSIATERNATYMFVVRSYRSNSGPRVSTFGCIERLLGLAEKVSCRNGTGYFLFRRERSLCSTRSFFLGLVLFNQSTGYRLCVWRDSQFRSVLCGA